jgi:hypothetical protein
MCEEDPLQEEQRSILESLLGRPLSPVEFEGFLIVGCRFIDRFGGTRIADLAKIFRTDLEEGRRALAESLSQITKNLGSYESYSALYPVTIIPPLPAFPMFKIVGIESFQDFVYRILDSRSPDISYIKAAGLLPERPLPAEPVLRKVPRPHWCAYEKWDTPEKTREWLQILPGWSNCEARATLSARAVKDLSYVSYTEDPNDPETRGLSFHGYFFEGIAQDHDELQYRGNAVQIGVYGQPEVAFLEEWDATRGEWRTTWRRS